MLACSNQPPSLTLLCLALDNFLESQYQLVPSPQPSSQISSSVILSAQSYTPISLSFHWSVSPSCDYACMSPRSGSLSQFPSSRLPLPFSSVLFLSSPNNHLSSIISSARSTSSLPLKIQIRRYLKYLEDCPSIPIRPLHIVTTRLDATRWQSTAPFLHPPNNPLPYPRAQLLHQSKQLMWKPGPRRLHSKG